MSKPPKLRQLQPTGVNETQVQDAERAEHERQQMDLLPFRLRQWKVARLEARLVKAVPASWPAIAMVRDFWESRQRALVLYGPRRSGKSVAGAYWLTLEGRVPVQRASIGTSWEWDATSRFYSVFDLEQAQTSFDREHQAVMEEMIGARALVLDDIGAETRSVQGGLTRVIYERHRYERATLITTNLNPQTFEQRYGARNVARINETGKFLGCTAKGGR